MPDYSRLNIRTENNRITNVEDIRQFLNQINIEQNVLEYLESLLNNIENSGYTNKNELVAVLQGKILETKMKEQEELNNKETIEQIKAYNHELKNLDILSTSMNENDSKKDIDYITFTKNGKTEMLATRDARALSHFIKLHASEIGGMTAEEIFHYFKEYVYLEVEFMEPDVMDAVHPERRARAVRDESYGIDYAYVEEFRNRYSIQDKIEVAIDNDGERLFRIGDGIFKCRDGANGRELVVLKQPKAALNISQIDEQGAIKPEVIQEPKVNPEQSLETINQEELVDDVYTELIPTDMTFERFEELLYNRNQLGQELDKDEVEEMVKFATNLSKTMVERYKTGTVEDRIEEALKEFMEPILYKETQIENGELPPDVLSQEEKELVELYKKQKETVKALGLNNVKRLEYTNKNNQRESGVAALVIVLELAMVGMYILMFLSLAK